MPKAKQTSVSLTDTQKEKVQELADRLGISFSAALRIMINGFGEKSIFTNTVDLMKKANGEK